MHDDQLNKILNSRKFENTNIDSLNDKIISASLDLAQQSPASSEFSSIKMQTSIKLALLSFSFVFGLAAGFNGQTEMLNSDISNYFYMGEIL